MKILLEAQDDRGVVIDLARTLKSQWEFVHQFAGYNPHGPQPSPEQAENTRVYANKCIAIAQALEDSVCVSTWQPIESAPKDGSAILVTDSYGVFVVRWDFARSEWVGADGDVFWFAFRPTHWQPLPPPPKEDAP